MQNHSGESTLFCIHHCVSTGKCYNRPFLGGHDWKGQRVCTAWACLSVSGGVKINTALIYFVFVFHPVTQWHFNQKQIGSIQDVFNS